MYFRAALEQGCNGLSVCAAEHAAVLTFPLAPFPSPCGRGRGKLSAYPKCLILERDSQRGTPLAVLMRPLWRQGTRRPPCQDG